MKESNSNYGIFSLIIVLYILLYPPSKGEFKRFPASKGEFNKRIPPLKGVRGMLFFKIRIAVMKEHGNVKVENKFKE